MDIPSPSSGSLSSLEEWWRASAAPNRRLDQWLWFARLVKSRSRGARFCAADAVAVNTVALKKANHTVRIGDTIAVAKGAFRRTVRVMGLGVRRGPPGEGAAIIPRDCRSGSPIGTCGEMDAAADG
jgi:ribosome-associated heat shock protein Hsp15